MSTCKYINEVKCINGKDLQKYNIYNVQNNQIHCATLISMASVDILDLDRNL